MVTTTYENGVLTTDGGQYGPQIFKGTPDELLATANAIERNSSKRGYSGVYDRIVAAEIRRAVTESQASR